MAINFPHSPSVNDTHTHSGKEWTWNGSSWILSTNASNYTLPIATAGALGGIKVGNRLTIDSSTGVLSADVQTSSYGNSDVDTHLNQSNPTSGYVLSWNGTDYAWVDNAGYSNTDVDTHLNQSNPTSGHVLSWNGTDYAWVGQSAGASVSVSDTAPSTPSNGDLWFKSDEAVLKVRYEDGSSNQWVDALPMGVSSGGGGGATVSVGDSAPSSPTAGDLWWDSDNVRLKVYYTDATPDSQWVDASPGSTLDLTAFTGNILPATHDQQDIGSATKKIRDLYLGSTSLHIGTVDVSESSGKLVLPAVEMTGHFIPDTNAAYDLGNAEYKIRHLFLSDNSLKFVDDNNTEHSLSVSSGKLHYQGKEVLANCVFTSLDNNDTIKYNGTNWVNAAAEAPSAPAFQSSWRIQL